MGVWIETIYPGEPPTGRKSHPSWVCGLKPPCECTQVSSGCVTPFVGVWIETQEKKAAFERVQVTPFVGVWIETLSGT